MQNVKTKTLRIRDDVQITLTVFTDVNQEEEGAKENLKFPSKFASNGATSFVNNTT